jgi:hypothetical protein
MIDRKTLLPTFKDVVDARRKVDDLAWKIRGRARPTHKLRIAQGKHI